MKQNNLTPLLNAANFWMGVECLGPGSAPKAGKDTTTGGITWDIFAETEMPWVDPDKVSLLRAREKKPVEKSSSESTWRFVAYCSLMPMPPIIQEIREHLGLEIDEFNEYRTGDPAAAIAVLLDRQGMVTDIPFISSMPWALGRVAAGTLNARIDFEGFFGVEQFQDTLRKDIVNMLFRRGVLAKDGSPALTAALPSEAQENGQTTQRPITLQDVRDICSLAFIRCAWAPTVAQDLRIQAKPISVKKGEQANVANENDMLNSFYVEDIHLVSNAIARGEIGEALASFMNARLRSDRIDIRSQHDQTIAKGVAPKEMPLGCWPSKHGLVLAQQFAVNTIIKNLLSNAGIFSVNGPPGTGKTTLLRDVIAAVVVDRAIAMAAFNDPKSAFSREITIEGWTYGKVWAVDASLQGNSIVVASANNGAVENITKELPSRDALPKDSTLNYFSALSDSIAAPHNAEERNHGATWGVFAAALGSKKNRNIFFQKFRWSPKPQKDDAPQPYPMRSLWDLIEAGDAAKPWDEARAAFAEALDRSKSLQVKMQKIADTLLEFKDTVVKKNRVQVLFIELSNTYSLQLEQRSAIALQASQARDLYQELLKMHTVSACRDKVITELRQINVDWKTDLIQRAPFRVLALTEQKSEAYERVRRAELLLNSHIVSKPGPLRQLINWKIAPAWSANLTLAQQDYKHSTDEDRRLSVDLQAARLSLDRHHELLAAQKDAEKQLAVARNSCALIGLDPVLDHDLDLRKIESAKSTQHQLIGALAILEKDLSDLDARVKVAKASLFRLDVVLEEQRSLLERWNITQKLADRWLQTDMSEDEIQLSAPWFNQENFAARQDLFRAAMDLHASFIAAGWSKLKNTLNALMSVNNGSCAAGRVDGGVTQLWEALFLVVPVVSTTFASFPRMFKGWGSESIGWLLIDEAGQATPQQAMGAIWRSRRVVVVGDPLQLEPIVSLPLEALEPLRKKCGADSAYSPINSSTQVLADMANSIGTMLGTGDEKKWVGSPLRVHRRCLSTMFNISNAIAYDGMMVYGTEQDERDLWFGNSCWIDVPADDAEGNCIPAQVKLAVELVDKFEQEYGVKTGDKFNLYVITPFKDVNAAVDLALYALLGPKKNGMHGTVHTFQGKEADVVIMVLGGDPKKPSLIPNFAAAKPNLLNVAVTRAKKRIYIIGDHAQWSKHRFFDSLAGALEVKDQVKLIKPTSNTLLSPRM